MNVQAMTQQEIRLTGIKILSQHMGLTGMIRFLQQTETGYGDYTKERDKLLGDPSLEEIVSDIQSSRFNKKEASAATNSNDRSGGSEKTSWEPAQKSHQ